MASVYLETSFFSVCVSNRTDPLTAGWRVTSNRWWQRQAPRHRIAISPEVIAELSSPTFPNREAAKAMLAGLPVLAITADVNDLAKVLVAERVMPGPSTRGDALHVALTAVHGIQYLLTWNIKHLANRNKWTHLAVVCAKFDLVAPEIVTPDMLQENDDE